MSLEQAVDTAKDFIDRANMCFMPDNLEFLRAGGRVSNVAFLGSRILGIHPCIEILEGKLVATKKYRGKMSRVLIDYVKDMEENLKSADNERVFITHSGCEQELIDKVYEILNI